jgi:Tfp pilus assembly PilM family ATPase
MTTATEQKATDRALALETLERVAEQAERGGYLVITIKSTSKSNMSFKFDVRQYYTYEGQVISDYLNWTYAQLMGMKQNQHGEVKGSGIGIDRAFEVANNLQWLIEKYLNKTLKIRYQGIY